MRRGTVKGGGDFNFIERQSEKLAHTGAHELDRPLHIGVGGVGHDIGAAAGAKTLDECKRVIRLAIYVNDDNFIGLRQHLRQVLEPGRKRGEFMEPEPRILGDSSGDDLAPFRVGPEKGDG